MTNSFPAWMAPAVHATKERCNYFSPIADRFSGPVGLPRNWGQRGNPRFNLTGDPGSNES